MSTTAETPAVQQTLTENERYSRRSILRSEKIYGVGFQSPGGVFTTKQFAAELDFAKKENLKVLDMGSGLGGAALHIAGQYKAHVVGIDYSQNMVDICNERLFALPESERPSVEFKQGDASDTSLFADGTFDVIWTRDSILYLKDKHLVYTNFYKWLKPGGQLFVTDFGRSMDEVSAEFEDYYTSCHYYLEDLQGYAKTLEKAGFAVEHTQDISSMFNELNRADLKILDTQRSTFLSDFTEEELNHLIIRWKKKISYTEDGYMKWLKLVGRK